MESSRYTKILTFIGIDTNEADKLFKFLGNINDYQRELVFIKQKQLLKECEKTQDLSLSENGIAFQLVNLRFFAQRRYSNDYYQSLSRDSQNELDNFKKAGMMIIKKRQKI